VSQPHDLFSLRSKTPRGPRRQPGVRARRSLVPAALLLVAVVGVWEAVTRLADVPDYLLPAPDAVGRTLWTDRDLLASASWVTAQEMLVGYVIAVAAAVAIAVTLHAFTAVRRAAYPLLIGSQTVPTVVVAPILAIALGYGMAPKLVVVALVCFFPVVVNTVDGLRGVDPELLRLMRTLDATRWATFRRVEFPAALPSLFSGARVAATFAAIGAVFGEWAGSTNGLGYVMIQATPQLETALVFAAIVILTVVSVALFGVVHMLQRVCAPWTIASQPPAAQSATAPPAASRPTTSQPTRERAR
jgi:putative hydroxymethylpyrimidine transport system permease protein